MDFIEILQIIGQNIEKLYLKPLLIIHVRMQALMFDGSVKNSFFFQVG